jgi:hypothetical protein
MHHERDNKGATILIRNNLGTNTLGKGTLPLFRLFLKLVRLAIWSNFLKQQFLGGLFAH